MNLGFFASNSSCLHCHIPLGSSFYSWCTFPHPTSEPSQNDSQSWHKDSSKSWQAPKQCSTIPMDHSIPFLRSSLHPCVWLSLAHTYNRLMSNPCQRRLQILVHWYAPQQSHKRKDQQMKYLIQLMPGLDKAKTFYPSKRTVNKLSTFQTVCLSIVIWGNLFALNYMHW